MLKIKTDLANLIRQFVKFGLVGVVNTAITWIAILVLSKVFLLSYTIANPIGYILGLVNSFILNKLWTFKSTGSIKKESLKFILVFLITYPIQYGITAGLIEIYKVNDLLAQAIAAVFYTGIGFFANKFITFRR